MADERAPFVAQRVSSRVESLDKLLSRVHAKTSKLYGVVAVLNLLDYTSLGAPCTRDMIEDRTSKVILNASCVEMELEEAKKQGLAEIPLIFVYWSPIDGTSYVIRAGCVPVEDTPFCFSVASLKRINSTPQTSIQLPLPPTLPDATDINKSTMRVGQVSFSRMVELIYALTDILDAENGVLPCGPEWWSWADNEVGNVSDEEDQFLVYFLILATCANPRQHDFIMTEFANTCVRCAVADPTFLGRLKKKHPAYRFCSNATMLKTMICSEFDKVSKMYYERYYSPDSDMVYTIPEHVKKCINIMHGIYDRDNEQ